MRKGEKARTIQEDEIYAFNEEYKQEHKQKIIAEKKKQDIIEKKQVVQKAPVLLMRGGFKRGEKVGNTVPQPDRPKPESTDWSISTNP
jgi:hypothetical protein